MGRQQSTSVNEAEPPEIAPRGGVLAPEVAAGYLARHDDFGNV